MRKEAKTLNDIEIPASMEREKHEVIRWVSNQGLDHSDFDLHDPAHYEEFFVIVRNMIYVKAASKRFTEPQMSTIARIIVDARKASLRNT